MKQVRYSVGDTFLKASNVRKVTVPKFLYDQIIGAFYRNIKFNSICKNDHDLKTKVVLLFKQKDYNFDKEFRYDPRNLQLLTSIDENDRYDIYLKTFKEIYEDSKYLNIGISGTYGSGKSSLIKVLKNQKFVGNHFSISLADFRNEGILKKDLPKLRSDMIEIKILRQLYY